MEFNFGCSGENMNYLVTGGCGFIGSRYVQMLLTNELGPVTSVKVLDKLTYAGSINNLDSIINDSRLRFIHGDICNAELVNSSVSSGDIIVHFAAESHVDRSIMRPADFIQTNIVGTQVLLSAAVEMKAKMFINISTDEVYGSIADGYSGESDPLLPNSPYAASKAASDLLVRAYIKTYGIDARITRCCNNYGPNQFPEKFIPFSVNQLMSGNKIKIYGHGLNVREWIHVEDHCYGIQAVINSGAKGQIYNIGSGIEYSNIELAKKMLSIVNLPEDYLEYVTDRPGHDFRYALDSSKIRQELGFISNIKSLNHLENFLFHSLKHIMK
jgi:dTDP-glucose 4,6-dehydratase